MSIEYVPVPIFNVQLATRVYDMFSHKHATSILVTWAMDKFAHKHVMSILVT